MAGKLLTIAEWRDSLFGDYKLDVEDVALAPAPSTSKPKGKKLTRAQEHHQITQNVHSLFGKTGGLPCYSPSQTALWGRREVSVETAGAVQLREEILWEVHKVNWRCELRALDGVMSGSADWSTLQRWDHEALVSWVWGSTVGALSSVPQWERERPVFCWPSSRDSGWKGCRCHLKALVLLMA